MFKQILRTPLVFNRFQTYYTKLVYYDPLVLTSFKETTVKNCNFIQCTATELDGGAILSFGPILVSDCEFRSCQTLKQAGTVMSHMNSTIERCIALDCVSYSVCTFCTDSTENALSVLSLISVTKGDCNRDGIINSGIDVETIHNDVNVSECTTDGTYCGSQIFNKKFTATYCNYVSNYHSYYSSGIGMEHIYDALIESCFFYNCTRKQEHPFGGYCLYFGDTSAGATVKGCSFVHARTPSKSSVYSAYRPDKLTIENCCFSENQERENWDFPYKDCQFNAHCKLDANGDHDNDGQLIPTKTVLIPHDLKMKPLRIVVLFIILTLVTINVSLFVYSRFIRPPAKKVE
ncbi:hypothetical protein TVAG_120110 [Trichomonas vaginalis G3]|uniref:Right handed beta helix domain-containing protein n=1 Tax=Trichomonas vaginalis (strain ATCC PRA-98 / G3) TaxID=412133 RepID=A2D7F7_TRIV3|nr:pectin lyase-like family [Trichomonas vaginalis G3]EAY23674.1 hypothetical protein TVAG_120110 [Trichomonas vaginalis G3]KAI5490166.1 pectin lyase-like family [Trichomonas vaginalis G3]|eukprot:XP_001276922.1 hypothetical protein [Trichomonas vaginalis G3]